ncbi:hypothetical protein YC2023_042023 [Brassica napus]
MHHLWLIRVAVSFKILRLRALPLPLESRTVHVIEEGPCEQRNQLFSVLGSLTDPEEEESKESSEVNSMSSLLFDDRLLLYIFNYQEEEVCKWSSVATHAEREELNGLSTVWLMNVALSLSSVVDVLSIISWLKILVIVEYDFRKETSKDSSDIVRRKLETLGCDSHQEESSQYGAEPHCYSSF